MHCAIHVGGGPPAVVGTHCGVGRAAQRWALGSQLQLEQLRRYSRQQPHSLRRERREIAPHSINKQLPAPGGRQRVTRLESCRHFGQWQPLQLAHAAGVQEGELGHYLRGATQRECWWMCGRWMHCGMPRCRSGQLAHGMRHLHTKVMVPARSKACQRRARAAQRLTRLRPTPCSAANTSAVWYAFCIATSNGCAVGGRSWGACTPCRHSTAAAGQRLSTNCNPGTCVMLGQIQQLSSSPSSRRAGYVSLTTCSEGWQLRLRIPLQRHAA